MRGREGLRRMEQRVRMKRKEKKGRTGEHVTEDENEEKEGDEKA